ncbi:MAG: hypothetical protein ACLR4W_10045 [Oscillospiraceae bacterium]
MRRGDHHACARAPREARPRRGDRAGGHRRRAGERRAQRCGKRRILLRRRLRRGKKLAQENLRPDVITVDPPRKGLAEDVVESIARMQPERVVYVSCDSATMARDVKRFATLGYRAVRACAVDLFPAPTMWRRWRCSKGGRMTKDLTIKK